MTKNEKMIFDHFRQLIGQTLTQDAFNKIEAGFLPKKKETVWEEVNKIKFTVYGETAATRDLVAHRLLKVLDASNTWSTLSSDGINDSILPSTQEDTFSIHFTNLIAQNPINVRRDKRAVVVHILTEGVKNTRFKRFYKSIVEPAFRTPEFNIHFHGTLSRYATRELLAEGKFDIDVSRREIKSNPFGKFTTPVKYKG